MVAFRNKIEGGSKSELFFDGGQPEACIMAFLRIDIMGEDDGELPSFRPAGPSPRREGRLGINWPDVTKNPQAPSDDHPADPELERTWDDRLEGIKKVPWHWPKLRPGYLTMQSIQHGDKEHGR